MRHFDKIVKKLKCLDFQSQKYSRLVFQFIHIYSNENVHLLNKAAEPDEPTSKEIHKKYKKKNIDLLAVQNKG